jgi:hypothetical protein
MRDTNTGPNSNSDTREIHEYTIEEIKTPQVYTHAGDQLGKGNPWVPYNNPTDTILNRTRVSTYFDDSLKPLNNLGAIC